MKQADIIQLSAEELQERLTEEKNLYSKLKINHAVSPVENPMKLRTTRKTIARLLTETNKRAKQTKNQPS